MSSTGPPEHLGTPPSDSMTPNMTTTYTNGHATHPMPPYTTTTSFPTTATTTASTQPITYQPITLPISFYPGGHRSLSTISLTAFTLGLTLGFCLHLTVLLVYVGCYLWRIPCFIAALCVFHYLEFDMTARYNTVDVKVSSFLLFNNGVAYDVANVAAVVECMVRWGMVRKGLLPRVGMGRMAVPAVLPTLPAWVGVLVAGVMVVLGQVVRSLAMRTAGRSFNHLVQSVKREGHVLVRDGVYAWSRHPSYLGFFWWGLGTQVLLGNRVCFVAYAVVLWNFFASRITNEEKYLVHFFGKEYLDYRAKVPVLIPFIQ